MMFVKWQVLANQAPQCCPSWLAAVSPGGLAALAAGNAAGMHSWQKTLLGKAGTATDLDGATLVYT